MTYGIAAPCIATSRACRCARWTASTRGRSWAASTRPSSSRASKGDAHQLACLQGRRPVEAIYGRPESLPTEGSGGIPRPLSQPPTGASTDFPPAFVGRPRVAGPRSLRRAPRRARAAGRSTSRCTGGARHCVGPVQMCVSERGSFDGDHRGLHGRRLDRGPAPGRRRPAAGLVAMSHGFGNKRAATMQTASRRPGVNVNMLQADRGRDPRAAQRLVPAVRCAGTRFSPHVRRGRGSSPGHHWGRFHR